MEPLWDRVDRNRVKLALTVVLFIVGTVIGIDLVIGIAWLLPVGFAALRGPYAAAQAWATLARVLGWAAVAGVGVGAAWTAVALTRSERWLVKRLGATIVPKGELLETKYALKDMAIAAGMNPAPALYVLETPNVNAFVFGAFRRRPVVGVTRGFATRLPVDEQRAAFANLVARLRSGDTIYATGVTALTRPLWRYRDRQLAASAETDSESMSSGAVGMDSVRVSSSEDAAAAVAWAFVVASALVAVTEVAAYGSRRSQLRQAEVADAEGMLLLKEPAAMLRALENCIRYNNFVPTAGPGFAQLFYCWTGDATDDEEDPEWQRVMRLREVLGVEGTDRVVSERNTRTMAVAPMAPRLEKD
jgi:Zn-dependent protease with chaperone function